MKLLKSIFQKATQAKFILTCYYDKNLNQTLAKSEPECYLNDLYVINQLNYKTSFQYANIIDKHK
jgi:hypothetical protein